MRRIGRPLAALVTLLLVACSTSAVDETPVTPAPTAAETAVGESSTVMPSTATPTPAPTREPTSEATPGSTPEPAPNLRATRLRIPALGIDSEVQGSQVVPDVGRVPVGCPAPPPGRETVTIPNYGIATPDLVLEGLEHKSWIYGHSRWLGEPGLFFPLKDTEVGDELFVSGVDHETGAPVTDLRFVVTGLYLTDIDSGAALIEAPPRPDGPEGPLVMLQTSVRERGADRPWILDRATVLSKSENLVRGDLEDPCKYLLLFVIAEAA